MIKVSCANCSKEVLRKPCDTIGVKNFFCSLSCRFDFTKARPNAVCDVCSKKFYRSPGHQKRRGAKNMFCSYKCSASVKIKFKTCIQCKKKHRSHHNWKFCSRECYSASCLDGHRRERFKTNCDYCKKELLILRCFIGKVRYCNRKCADLGHSIRMRGKGNSNFIHGNANFPYPPVWNDRLKKSIRDRDGNLCQMCGLSKLGLHVHHIDWIKDHSYPLNLISLCHPCHRKCHTKKERLTKELLLKLQERAKFLTMCTTFA